MVVSHSTLCLMFDDNVIIKLDDRHHYSALHHSLDYEEVLKPTIIKRRMSIYIQNIALIMPTLIISD